jgi:hypothetical protein
MTMFDGRSLSKWEPNKNEDETMRSLIVDFINRLKMAKSYKGSSERYICISSQEGGGGAKRKTYAQKYGKHWRIDLQKYTAKSYYADFHIQVGEQSYACLLLQTDQWFKSGHVRMALQLSLLTCKNVTLQNNSKDVLTFPEKLPPDVRDLWNRHS